MTREMGKGFASNLKGMLCPGIEVCFGIGAANFSGVPGGGGMEGAPGEMGMLATNECIGGKSA
ncbi:MAG: hypothetical protein CM15mP46_1590 [Alphaproteobacteria bacterium]|nr:MAG: hypothetical protein CM15mP46_1590 [Alphaproteobacteria bacterium]